MSGVLCLSFEIDCGNRPLICAKYFRRDLEREEGVELREMEKKVDVVLEHECFL